MRPETKIQLPDSSSERKLSVYIIFYFEKFFSFYLINHWINKNYDYL